VKNLGLPESGTVIAWIENRVAQFSMRSVLADKKPHTHTHYLCEDWVTFPRVVNHQIRTKHTKSEQALFERLRLAGIADLGGRDE